MKNILTAILDLVYPRSCVSCKKSIDTSWGREVICENCYEAIKVNTPPFCKKCGRHLESKYKNPNKDICLNCQKKTLYFDRSWSACIYNDKMKDMMHLFKYGHKTILRKPFAGILLKFIQDLDIPIQEFDYLVPVPLHPTRLREREYNQTQLLTKELSKSLSIKINQNNAVRIRNTAAQSQLGASNRWENVKGAFKIKNSEEIKGKNILIIDDLYTTGATASEIALTLKNAGAKSVFILTLAVAE